MLTYDMTFCWKQFDQSSTLKILGAVSSLVDDKNEDMIQALMRITSPEVVLDSTMQDKEGSTIGNHKRDSSNATGLSSAGEEDSESSTVAGTESAAQRRGPLRLIHVVFGLCLEILAKTSSTGSTISQSSINLNAAGNDGALQGCLGALDSILKPSYIDQEFLSRVFLEMMTILERVAWMEGSRVQGLVVRVISTAIQGYGSDMFFVDEEKVSLVGTLTGAGGALEEEERLGPKSSGDAGRTSVLPGSRLQSILQLLVELYIQKCVGSNVKAIKTLKTIGSRAGQKTTPETVELLSQVTEILAMLVKVAPPKYQLHLAAVTLNVLIGKFPGHCGLQWFSPSVDLCPNRR